MGIAVRRTSQMRVGVGMARNVVSMVGAMGSTCEL